MLLTPAQIIAATRIHKALYGRFVWTSDEDIHSVVEYWDRIPLTEGKYRDDCDSFAIEMDFRLKDIGIPKEARRLGACSIEHKVLDHCVLILMGEKTLYVSDCNTPTIVPLESLPYSNWYWSDPSGNITLPWLPVFEQ